MRIPSIITVIAAVSVMSTPALAAEDGHWQVRLLGTGVLPSGKINEVKTDLIGLPAGSAISRARSVARGLWARGANGVRLQS